MFKTIIRNKIWNVKKSLVPDWVGLLILIGTCVMCPSIKLHFFFYKTKKVTI